MTDSNPYSHPIPLPRIAIEYCTQCRWMLRAAYFAQELLTTFSTSIGEIALIPKTGGIFTVTLSYQSPVEQSSDITDSIQLSSGQTVNSVLIWDRKRDGGFPETKILKQKIRNFIEPDKNLGHSDTPSTKVSKPITTDSKTEEKPVQLDQKDTGTDSSNVECKTCD